MDIWSESRLSEIGIEDVQHLATANLIDVILGARIATQRIVDWVDQALLLIRTGLPRVDNLAAQTTYAQLRALGVRSSVDLLELVATLGLELRPGGAWPADASPAGFLGRAPHSPPANENELPSLAWAAELPLLTRIAVATTLQHEPNLTLLLNWHCLAPEGTVESGRRGCGELPSNPGRSRQGVEGPAGRENCAGR